MSLGFEHQRLYAKVTLLCSMHMLYNMLAAWLAVALSYLSRTTSVCVCVCPVSESASRAIARTIRATDTANYAGEEVWRVSIFDSSCEAGWGSSAIEPANY